MLSRPDLLDEHSPSGLEVFQLTTETDVPSSHVYMEAQIFSPDSRRFLLHRAAHAHGSNPTDPRHRYLLCDLENGGLMTPVTDELGATAPSIAPDGQSFYYFVDETRFNGGRLLLKRRRIDGSQPETLVVVDRPLGDARFHLSRVYPLSTIRSDGRKIAVSAFFGDGQTLGEFGLMVFDTEAATVELILHGSNWCNIHPQYSRSRNPLAMCDILVQENHGCQIALDGAQSLLTSGLGADIHVVRDDGQHLRDMPWGRDEQEVCQGHQCWRGRSDWAITSTVQSANEACRLLESQAVPQSDHRGFHAPNGRSNDLTRQLSRPNFYHFATDIEGRRFITDYGAYRDGENGFRPTTLHLATLGEPGVDALHNLTYLLHPRASWHKDVHMHPFLSPDGTMAFFNSDESGVLQAYMLRGLPQAN